MMLIIKHISEIINKRILTITLVLSRLVLRSVLPPSGHLRHYGSIYAPRLPGMPAWCSQWLPYMHGDFHECNIPGTFLNLQ